MDFFYISYYVDHVTQSKKMCLFYFTKKNNIINIEL